MIAKYAYCILIENWWELRAKDEIVLLEHRKGVVFQKEGEFGKAVLYSAIFAVREKICIMDLRQSL